MANDLPPTGTPDVNTGWGYPAQPGPAAPYGAPPTAYAAAGAPALWLPPGVTLASPGRRVGAYFLAIPLWFVTLGIGYVIWGAIVWSKGTSPALQVLGMKAWVPAEQRVGTWGTMAMRNGLDYLISSVTCGVSSLVSFVMFLTDDQNRTLADRIGSTVIVHDPTKQLQ